VLSNIYDSITENSSLILTLRNKVEVTIAILSVGVNHFVAREEVLAVKASDDGHGHGWCPSVVGSVSIAWGSDSLIVTGPGAGRGLALTFL
jgi:hypothetical protein